MGRTFSVFVFQVQTECYTSFIRRGEAFIKMLTLISFFVSPQPIPALKPVSGALDVIGNFQMESILSESREDLR